MNSINTRQRYDLGELLRENEQELSLRYKLSFAQERAIADLIKCRTAESGGHAMHCNRCGYTEYSYNSCRNRHCPKCQFVKQEQWIDKLKSGLPATDYRSNSVIRIIELPVIEFLRRFLQHILPSGFYKIRYFSGT